MTSTGIVLNNVFQNRILNKVPLNVDTEETEVSIMSGLNHSSECKDGNDDGKIGFIESVKALKNGAKEELKHQTIGKIKEMAKKPLKTAVTATTVIAGVAAATSILGAPVVMAGLGILGVITGIKNVFKDVKNLTLTIDKAKKAKTDAEKVILMEQLGKNGINFIEDTGLTAISSLQMVRAGAKITGCSEIVENSIQKVSSNTVNSIETTSENITNSFEKIDKIYNGKYENLLSNGADGINNTAKYVNDGINYSLKASNTIKDDVMGLIYVATKGDNA